MIVKHNISALNTSKTLGIIEKNKLKSLEKISSGYRINRAADDAAGLAISEEMRGQIRGLNRAVQNIEEGIGYVQTADAALSEVHAILQRIRELAVESADDTNTEEDREYLDLEVQMLKEEMDRIFEETEFNTIPIWTTDTNNRVQIGTESKQAVTMQYYNNTMTITEINKGAVALNQYAHTGVDGYSTYFKFSSSDCGYKIEVQQATDPTETATYGFKVTWNGWNGNKYSTDLVPWTDVGTGAFSMNIADYFPNPTPVELTGINFKLGWNTADSNIVTIQDVAQSIDGIVFNNNISASESALNEQAVLEKAKVSSSISINYLAELASGRNMDSYDTTWIEPVVKGATNVTTQPSYTNPRENTGWVIRFIMPGIGPVTAKSSYIAYSGRDRTNETYQTFWRYDTKWNGKEWVTDYDRKVGLLQSPDARPVGSLHALTDCASNDNATDINSLRNSIGGGSITLAFNITPDAGSYSYGGRSHTEIGTIRLSFSVPQNATIDAESYVMNEIKKALNSDTVFDIYEGNKKSGAAYRATQSVGSSVANNHKVNVPLYKANIDIAIQAGANANQLIHVTYDSLRILNLGLADTNITDRKTATKAIAQIDAATEVISAQRSLFGSYQNRFDHAGAVNENTSENLQDAESKIRDVDIADEMVRLSATNILAQAGQAMLAQANRITEGMLGLLR